MAVQWFYGANHARLGPVSAKQLKELKEQGQLQPSDMVWKEGITNGLRAGDITGLFRNEPTTTVVVETADLPVLNTLIEKPEELPVATNAPKAVQGQAQAITPQIAELIAIPEDAEYALRVANALLLLQKPNVPTPYQLELPPKEPCVTEAEPGNQTVAAPVQPRIKPPVVRPKRAVVESGAVLVSQDGERVRFRKKCVRCGFVESCNSVMRLMPGVNRQLFFCPKCRKQVGISIRAM